MLMRVQPLIQNPNVADVGRIIYGSAAAIIFSFRGPVLFPQLGDAVSLEK